MKLFFLPVVAALAMPALAEMSVVYNDDPLMLEGSGWHAIVRPGEFRPDAGDECVTYLEYVEREAPEHFEFEGERFAKIELVDERGEHLRWLTLEEIDALARATCSEVAI